MVERNQIKHRHKYTDFKKEREIYKCYMNNKQCTNLKYK